MLVAEQAIRTTGSVDPVYAPPASLAKALHQVDAWMESPTVALLTESATHWPTLRDVLAAGRIAGGMVHDARVAALCRQRVRELWSADRDFRRFTALSVVNPLLGEAAGQCAPAPRNARPTAGL